MHEEKLVEGPKTYLASLQTWMKTRRWTSAKASTEPWGRQVHTVTSSWLSLMAPLVPHPFRSHADPFASSEACLHGAAPRMVQQAAATSHMTSSSCRLLQTEIITSCTCMCAASQVPPTAHKAKLLRRARSPPCLRNVFAQSTLAEDNSYNASISSLPRQQKELPERYRCTQLCPCASTSASEPGVPAE